MTSSVTYLQACGNSADFSAKETGAGGEIQITDAMIGLLKTQDFPALKYEGRTFDYDNDDLGRLCHVGWGRGA
jgi:hypothetical protein